MGFPRDRVLEALALGPDLLTKRGLDSSERTPVERQELRQMAVAYHLMFDHQQAKASSPQTSSRDCICGVVVCHWVMIRGVYLSTKFLSSHAQS